MEQFFADFIKNINELHADVLQTLNNLPPEALDWSPLSKGNSCSVIVTHIAGAEKYWLGDVVAGNPTGRDRDEEFRAKDLSHTELAKRLQETSDFMEGILSGFNLEVLESSRVSPRNNQEVTVAWALGHTLKHTSIHLGHIQITRQLWEEQNKD